MQRANKNNGKRNGASNNGASRFHQTPAALGGSRFEGLLTLESPDRGGTMTGMAWPTELLVLRGEDRADLYKKVQALDLWLAEHPAVVLKDLAATLNVGLPAGGSRLAVVAGSVDELKQRLARAASRLADGGCEQIDDVAGIYFTQRPLAGSGRVVGLFPGEGAQYLRMLADLRDPFPEVAEAFEWGDRLARTEEGKPGFTAEFIHLPDDLSPEDEKAAEARLRRLDTSMFGVLLADLAISRLHERLGLEMHAVAGHSAGELAALFSAGSFNPEQGLEQIPRMLKTLEEQDRAADGGETILLAVGASRDTMNEVIAAAAAKDPSTFARSHAFVAMDNCPHQSVVVCEPEAAVPIEAELAARRLMHERLPFGRPYHTHLFEPYLGPLEELFAAVPFQTPKRRIYSCTTAELFPNGPAEIRRLALRHWAAPVEFTGMIRRMHADGARIFVEAGPRGNLTAFISDILRGEEFVAVASNVPRRSGLTQLNHMAGKLVAHHVHLRLAHFYERRNPQHIDWSGSAHAPATPVEPATVAEPKSANAADSPQAANVQPPPAAPKPSGSAAAQSGRANVVNQYWDVMARFIDDQQAIMNAYLQSPRTKRRRPRHSGKHPRQGAQPTPAAITHVPAAQELASEQFPLMGDIVHHVPGHELVMRRLFDLEEDLFAAEHTVGGREVSSVEPDQVGLPVVPMTFDLEIMAEMAATLFPGMTVIGLRDVQIQRWLAYEGGTIDVEVKAHTITERVDDPEPLATQFVRVEIRDLAFLDGNGTRRPAAVASGTVILASRYPEAPLADYSPLVNDHPSNVSIDLLYRNLFHGPSFQGVTKVVTCGDRGVDSQIRVQPRDKLFRSNKDPKFLVDPVTVDIGMHPAVAWHLEQPDQEGRIFLPFEIKRITFFGPSPEVGTELGGRSLILKMTARNCINEGQMHGADNRIWCQLDGVKTWRFYMPFAEVTFHGPKDEYFLTRDWPQALPPGTVRSDDGYVPSFGGRGAPSDARAWCVVLEPTTDVMQSVMLAVSARVTLSYPELEEFHDLKVSAYDRACWLFSRLSAKDALRILWRIRHGDRLFPADLEVEIDQYGRPLARMRGQERPDDFPSIATIFAADLFAGVASYDTPCGVAIEPVLARQPAGSEDAHNPGERDVLADWVLDDNEVIARLTAAKKAVASALGPALVDDLRRLTVRSADREAGVARVAIDGPLADMYPEYRGRLIDVQTLRHKHAIIATTLCQSERADA